jgi:DNA end-binding protein Ku
VFVLETMFWPDEIRAADFETVHEDGKIREQEVEMAKTLIENLSGSWNPQEYQDDYREALLEVVEKKAEGEEIEAPPEAQPARVVDLMEALKASVEAVKKQGPSAGSGSAGAAKSPAKKSSAKKSTAKSSAKKTTATRKKAAAG